MTETTRDVEELLAIEKLHPELWEALVPNLRHIAKRMDDYPLRSTVRPMWLSNDVATVKEGANSVVRLREEVGRLRSELEEAKRNTQWRVVTAVSEENERLKAELERCEALSDEWESRAVDPDGPPGSDDDETQTALLVAAAELRDVLSGDGEPKRGWLWEENAILRSELEDNPAADALDLLWRDIILARKPNYGDWEYPGQAYRHLLAEFNDVVSELEQRDAALRSATEVVRSLATGRAHDDREHLCWCPLTRDRDRFGHAPWCVDARNWLAATEPTP